MPDEVNIDELLELDSEAERSRKIQVGGEKGKRRPSPQSNILQGPKQNSPADMFIKHFLCQALNPPQNTIK